MIYLKKLVLFKVFIAFYLFSFSQDNNTAMHFDGNDDVISLGSVQKLHNIKDQMTLEAWIRLDRLKTGTGATPATIISGGNGDTWRLEISKDTGGNPNFKFSFGSGDKNQAILDDVVLSNCKIGVWHHIAVTLKKVKVSEYEVVFYYDGVFAGSFTKDKSNFKQSTGQTATIGGMMSSTNKSINNFPGLIDEVRIWSTARSRDEIKKNIYKPLKGTEAGLVAYFDFEEGKGGEDNRKVSFVNDKASSPIGSASVKNFTKKGNTSNWVKARRPSVYSKLRVTHGYDYIIKNTNKDRPYSLGTIVQGKGSASFDFKVKYIVGNTWVLNKPKIDDNKNFEIEKVKSTSNDACEFRTIRIKLNRTKPGAYSTKVTFTHDVRNQIPWDKSPFVFYVEGTIVEGVRLREGADNTGKIIAKTEKIDFGKVEVGKKAEKKITIENLSSSELKINMIDTGSPSVYEIIDPPKSIPAGGHKSFTLQLKSSTEVGKYDEALSIRTDLGLIQRDAIVEVIPSTKKPDINKDIVVYNVVTPNGDEAHDFLLIKNIHFYPNNKVTILNRWGDILYEVSGYDNNKVKFVGDANKGSYGQLDPGNYYYAIDPGDGQDILTGFLFLER